MTSIIFSFVYLVNINRLISKKNFFYFILVLTQVPTLLAFLSTNLLGFLVYFEAALFPMAILIGQ